MILCTIKKEEDYTIDFVKYIIQQIKLEFIELLDKKKLDNIEKQIKDLYPNLDSAFNLQNICIISIEKCLILEDEDEYQIVIDSNLKLKEIRIQTLFQVLNDGSLEIQAYPIFKEVKNIVEKNINSYFKMYQLGIEI